MMGVAEGSTLLCSRGGGGGSRTAGRSHCHAVFLDLGFPPHALGTIRPGMGKLRSHAWMSLVNAYHTFISGCRVPGGFFSPHTDHPPHIVCPFSSQLAQSLLHKYEEIEEASTGVGGEEEQEEKGDSAAASAEGAAQARHSFEEWMEQLVSEGLPDPSDEQFRSQIKGVLASGGMSSAGEGDASAEGEQSEDEDEFEQWMREEFGLGDDDEGDEGEEGEHGGEEEEEEDADEKLMERLLMGDWSQADVDRMVAAAAGGGWEDGDGPEFEGEEEDEGAVVPARR